MEQGKLLTVFRIPGEWETESYSAYSEAEAERARHFHAGFPGYAPTRLVSLRCRAKQLGVRGIYIKDESSRFGLNAFKSLGGSYAIGHVLADRLGVPMDQLTYDWMVSPEAREKLGDVTFVTATDGNHGRGVAWTAHCLGQKCVVYMPKGTARERLENIRALGADASILAAGYDDCVRRAKADADRYGWILVQDTSFPGYEVVPQHIMQGYLTMALEACTQLGDVVPTHVFLQAGVGSMAAAVAAFLWNRYRDAKPMITVVEPNTAECMYLTAAAGDGKLHAVPGEMHTMMAGLACGEPNPEAWRILGTAASCFASMPDEFAAAGMRGLAYPDGEDEAVVSGESGASSYGFVQEVLRRPELEHIRRKLGLNEDSVILCFSTEGATDRENYARVVGKTADEG